ncbi:S41 family peptidase [Daejeonella sp.]|uniref:S41 family peptidase n=1 Tax=Daejeonella sp. TaxID=2805397 RepID=UPI00273404BF|nr:S41 family peptidase [Daejeonella sp.]
MNLRSISKLLIFSLSLLMLASSCKKDPKASVGPEPNPTVPVVASRSDLTKDSIFLYAKETYYWNEGMPTYAVFNPRSYGSNQAVLNAIIALPGTNKPTDKYSFLDDGSVSTSLGGVSGDFGFSVFYHDTDGISSTPTDDLRIKYVSPNSPAASKGLKRGYQIKKLNGRTDLSTSQSATLDFVGNAVFGSANSVSMTILKPDGSLEDVTITRASYSNNPIFLTKILNAGSKKVGYIVYNSFTTNSRDALTTEISKFQTAGATELIVDLRYNGGGSVATADVFTNLIAPAAYNGQVMYTTIWTKTMQDGNAKILSHQPLLDAQGKLQSFTGGVNGVYATYADINYKVKLVSNVDPALNDNVEIFKKIGGAEFSKIYFLVLSGTASASELLINSMKGVMPSNVKIIGQKTYGKPVGFFAIKIDKLDLYVPQFETKNQKNEGGYYSGMAVDYSVSDDVTKDFGDPTERLLAAALSYSEKGTFSISNIPSKIASVSGMSAFETQRLNEVFDKNVFKGMIDDKLRFKKQ